MELLEKDLHAFLKAVQPRILQHLFDKISLDMKAILIVLQTKRNNNSSDGESRSRSNSNDVEDAVIRDYNLAANVLYQITLRDLKLLHWWCSLDEQLSKYIILSMSS